MRAYVLHCLPINNKLKLCNFNITRNFLQLRVYTPAYGEHVAGAFQESRYAVVDDLNAPSATSAMSEMEEFESMLSDMDLWHDADLMPVGSLHLL